MRLLIALLFVNSFALGRSFLPVSKVGMDTDGLTIEASLAKCQLRYNEPCVDISKSGNHSYYVASDEMVDDPDSPIWGTRSMVESCAGEVECKAQASAKACVDGRESFYNEEYSETWCNKITGYNQKTTGRKIVVVDEVKKAAHDAEQAQKIAMDNAMAAAKMAMQCGEDVKALLIVRNASKGLLPAQIKQMVSTYSEIDALLSSGSLNTAKAEIEAVTADGTIITNDDKAALVAKINECLQ